MVGKYCRGERAVRYWHSLELKGAATCTPAVQILRAVFSTLILLKRVVELPWETALIWLG